MEAADRVGRTEVDQHRYDLKAPIDSEKPSKGSAGYLKRRHFEAEETVSMRDEIGPEILKTCEKLGIRLAVVTMHACMSLGS